MKLTHALAITLFASAGLTPALASDTRIELSAYVPTSCSMRFSEHLQQVAPDSFSLGDVEQFCNTNYRLTLMHAPLDEGKQFRFGDRVTDAGATLAVLQPMGRPVIDTKPLLISGVDENEAESVGHSLVLQVTPEAL